MTGRRGTAQERLERNSIPEPNSGCWLWLASVNKNGYAQIMMPGGKLMRAHRLSYKVFKGPLPRGKDIRHTCDVRCCINPDHLIPGTRKQNMDDARRRGRLATGFKFPHTKLTVEQCEAIVADKRVFREIASDYGVVETYVCKLKRRQGISTIRPHNTYAKGPRPNIAGEKHHQAVLTWKKIQRIRKLYDNNSCNQSDLARRFNISQAQISRIVRREAWICA